MKIEKKFALLLLEAKPNSSMIESIMNDSEYESAVCKEGVGQLRRHGYKGEAFLELLIKSNYKESLLQACAEHLDLENIKMGIFRFLERVNFHWSIASQALRAIKLDKLKENELIMLMMKFHREEVFNACWPLLKLKEKNEEELWELLRLLDFSWYAKEKIAPLLKDEAHLLKIISLSSESSLDEKSRSICFKGLKLEEKNEEELTRLAEISKFNPYLCEEIIKYSKTEMQILWVASSCPNNWGVSLAAINKLVREENIMLITHLNKHVIVLCQAAAAKVSEKYLMEIWSWHEYSDEIARAVITHLNLSGKTEEELIEYIKKDKYGGSVCKACKPYFKLNKKVPSEIITLLSKTGFHEDACRLFLPAHKLKKMGEKEIFILLEKSGGAPSVGKVLLEYLSSEEYILKFVQKMKYTSTTFWVKAFSELLAKKTDKEIFNILKDFHNEKIICRVAIKYQNKKDYILETIRASGYDEATMKIGLERISKIPKKTRKSPRS